MPNISKGAIGEVVAARFLREKGYTVVSSNYRCRQGEIDIIATTKDYIVFAEVKTRRHNSMYSPREAVTWQKQRRLIQTALIYLSKYTTDLQPRFDVIEVLPGEIRHIENAFDATDMF